jgi:hypothetical protein
MLEQLAVLKGKYINYSDYASQKITDVFSADQLGKARKLKAETFEHLILENMGDFNFNVHQLPEITQWAPVYAITASDVNADGNPDIILAGNFFDSRVKFGRLDASRGIILLGDGNGKWESLFPTESGLNLNGEIRDIIQINDAHENEQLLISQTDGPILQFIINPKNKISENR